MPISGFHFKNMFTVCRPIYTYTLVRTFIMSVVCTVVIFSQAAHAFDVSTLAGRWIGEGNMISKNDEVEKMKCRLTFIIKDKAKVEQNIRCRSDSYQIEVRNVLIQKGNKISGTWKDRLNELNGTINGTVRGQNIKALVKGETFNSTLNVKVENDRQKIQLKPANGPIKLINFELARG